MAEINFFSLVKSPTGNGYGNMLVGAVEKREADLSMNLALTGAREKVVDFSVAYIG